ncbi:RCC1/BLIP-II protein [Basidiobolus meristosporus CBS 931.73]|uniref:RCC1/BLIP-II protein n=1 Tax=Basidiobolus meristosporus CBS 931.73 TaxID=1314790 RepID=A0A1Y1Y8L6_9FUNG|nr:RCC1/BLIP-II protein [Basidiobolus meristosporus CBS 931.73]|eukprot:ORX94086.1 RCC1/BLIP-II protein [Basidiobolus meristosporus CBS 931.73]
MLVVEAFKATRGAARNLQHLNRRHSPLLQKTSLIQKRLFFNFFRSGNDAQGLDKESSASAYKLNWEDSKPRTFCWDGSHTHMLGEAFPKPVLIPALNDHKIDSFSCGVNHSTALVSKKVFSWGTNDYGQVGPTHQVFALIDDDSDDQVNSPFMIPSLADDDFKAIASGNFHNLALSEEGKLWTWGAGILGRGTEIYDTNPGLVTFFDEIERVPESIHAAGDYSLVVARPKDPTQNLQEVYIWGYLPCQNDGAQKALNPILVEGLLGTAVEQIVCSPTHFTAMGTSLDNGKPTMVSFGQTQAQVDAKVYEKPYYPTYHDVATNDRLYSEKPNSVMSPPDMIRQICPGRGFDLLLLEHTNPLAMEADGSIWRRTTGQAPAKLATDLPEKILQVAVGGTQVAAVGDQGGVYLWQAPNPDLPELGKLIGSKQGSQVILRKPGLAMLTSQYDRFMVC